MHRKNQLMVYISLGSNLGNRLAYLQKAVSLIKQRCLNNVHCSIIIETEALLPKDAPQSWNKPFLNMVLKGEARSKPDELLKELKRIEQELGREASAERWSPRVIDLDILLWDGVSIAAKSLTIPHRELKNREFLTHLLASLGKDPENLMDASKICSRVMTIEPKLVGVVNVTEDSFSDGGLYSSSELALKQAINLSNEGASVVEFGAQSTRPTAIIKGAEAEYSALKPVLDAIYSANTQEMIISIDSFWPEVIQKILKNYPINWVNDVKGDLDKETLKIIADANCSLVTMHSLDVPPIRENTIPSDEDAAKLVKNWAAKKIAYLKNLGFSEDKIIIDSGIGFGKSIGQNIALLKAAAEFKSLGCKTLIGHSRKSFMSSFTLAHAAERDIETIAISSLLKNNADYLRVHNVKDHMRFFAAQNVLNSL